MTLPSIMKIRRGYTKYVLREAMKGILPEPIRRRVSKLGFATPERKWQMTRLKPMIEMALQSARMRRYIDPNGALKWFHAVQQSPDTDFLPWRWLNLYRWLEIHDA